MTCYGYHFCGVSPISSSLKFQGILRTAACRGSFAIHGVKIHSTQLQETLYTLTDVCSGACAHFIYPCALYGPKRLHHYYVQAVVRWEEKPTRGGQGDKQTAQWPLLSVVKVMDSHLIAPPCHHPWSCMKLCASLAAGTASVLEQPAC